MIDLKSTTSPTPSSFPSPIPSQVAKHGSSYSSTSISSLSFSGSASKMPIETQKLVELILDRDMFKSAMLDLKLDMSVSQIVLCFSYH